MGRRNQKKLEKEGEKKKGIPSTEISKCGTHCLPALRQKNKKTKKESKKTTQEFKYLRKSEFLSEPVSLLYNSS